MGTGECRRIVALKPLYDVFGSEKSSALIDWHALTGCDTTGHIQEKGKRGCFTAFFNSSDSVVVAIAGLGKDVEPSAEVVRGCEEFLCSVLGSKKLQTTNAKQLRWDLFKQLKPDQGVGKLPPTPGAWNEHIQRAHVQAREWPQDLTLYPDTPDPLYH